MNRLTIRLDFAAGHSLGPGKVGLLEAVAKTGSIRQAARATGMSFRQAWLLLQAIDAMFGQPAVETARGGARGGGARLTPLGRFVVAQYRSLERAATKASRLDLAALAAKIRPASREGATPEPAARQRLSRKSLKKHKEN